jgi:hypothetical protein
MITFDIRANTTGWVGFGMAQNPQYQGVNLFIAYADYYNRVRLGEYYSQSGTYNPTPIRQAGGNSTIIGAGGYNREGLLSLTFSRKLDTNSTLSVPIVKGQFVPMVFSRRDVGDPSSEGGQLYPETKRSLVRVVLYPSSYIVPLRSERPTRTEHPHTQTHNKSRTLGTGHHRKAK